MAGDQAFERENGAQEVKLGGPSALRRLMLSGLAAVSYPGSQAEQLLLAPQELRTADPSFATEIYNGHFGLAGKLADIGAKSPFEIDPPSARWARELYGFGWLRHLRAADSELSREQAKTLVHDFIRLRRQVPSLAWQPEIVARRVISWLSNSVLVLAADEPEAYESFLKELTAQLRYLSAGYRDAPDGVPRLLSLTALLYGGLCIADQKAVVDRYTKPFCRELDRQILPDGGHISRNPEALIELLLDLLPLRQCFVARDRTPPKELTDAVDRIMPMLRFFRLGDGSMARFNGAGPTPTDALATVRAYDDIDGAPVRSAANSGYVRVEAGSILILCDLGPPPAKSLTRQAHAGFLSFEMSSGDAPIIINCGAPTPEFEEWRLYSRTTPAHSTLSLEDDSLAEFELASEDAEPEADAALIGPLNPQGAFSDQGEGGNLRIKGSHDGYVERYGVSHARQILIAPDGNLISSEDKLSTRGLKSPDVLIAGAYAVRFHLHPSVKAQTMGDGMSAVLVLRNGETWRLTANAEEMSIEESVLLADPRGPQVTSQIVLSGMMGDAREVRIVWNLEKMGDEAAPHALVDPNDAPDNRSNDS
ncbi:heparinase II/III family protein [Methyloceanibacter caenitepidi]|uniref:Heparinase II/III-like n=1 Tax=Methyloceanibacter caenitepidi TaxID=1384459 RepID=A0A0A8JZJ3_9HYPH|nr:heparinase II/III family protein [Methyloceanibacter caenitepidi]BAQ15831.1 heparinase II/III-like [Methyloceanibacter caenitepidi]